MTPLPIAAQHRSLPMSGIMSNMRKFVVLALLLLSFVKAFGQPPTIAAKPGAVIMEPPTTGALGVEWHIEGDDNRNASAALAWRRTGEMVWRAIHVDTVFAQEVSSLRENRFTGQRGWPDLLHHSHRPGMIG